MRIKANLLPPPGLLSLIRLRRSISPARKHLSTSLTHEPAIHSVLARHFPSRKDHRAYYSLRSALCDEHVDRPLGRRVLREPVLRQRGHGTNEPKLSALTQRLDRVAPPYQLHPCARPKLGLGSNTCNASRQVDNSVRGCPNAVHERLHDGIFDGGFLREPAISKGQSAWTSPSSSAARSATPRACNALYDH